MAALQRAARLLGLLSLIGGMSSGCSLPSPWASPSMPRVLRVAKSSTDPGSLNVEEAVRDRRVVKDVQGLLQEFDPGLRLHPTAFSEATLVRAIARQTSSGLGPDLIITNGNTSLALPEQQLTTPIPLEADTRSQISPLALQRVTTPAGAIAGVPVSQYVQLACYDKRRLADPPTTLAELASASGQGKVFGFAMHLEDLYWTLGGFQATPALQTALDAQPPSREDRHRLKAWLTWLQTASFQQNVLFLNNQMALRDQLVKGKLDWITCWSSQLPHLRTALNNHLGVTILPSGPLGQATPITRLQVWALGRNSSARQRRESLKLLRFMVEPWAQKTLSLKYRTSFPVNPQVAPIVKRQLAGERQIAAERLELGLTDQDSTRHANALLAALGSDPERLTRVNSILNGVVFGTLPPSQATQALLDAISGEQP